MARSLFLIFTVILLSRCATVTAPEGGARDETPPQLVPENSTPNLQTNFTKQRIELTFDEWVTLEDIFNQVVVSPPLQYRPDITLKGKTVRFDFDGREVLRDSATYTINFGEAVKDLTEKNPAENLRFVFSTGPVLDSLTVSGKIVDAKTGEPVEKALFMLYDNLADSVVRTERPFYFAKTDKTGNFRIENVRAGTFKGFALKDVDFNYRYNLANEQIGFPDTLIMVSDSTPEPLEIRLFEEERALRLLEESARNYGRIKLTFNKIPRNVDFSVQDIGQEILYEYDKDTVNVWYDLTTSQAWNLYIRQDTILHDTVQVPALDKAAFLQNARLLHTNSLGPQGISKLNPDKFILLRFNHPIAQYDTSLIRLYEDTLRTQVRPIIEKDTLSPRQLRLRHPWKEGMTYELEAMPGAFRDMFGLESDTIQAKYLGEFRKAFGNLTLTLDSLKADTNYVVQLLQGESNVVDEFQVNGVQTFKKQFKTLPPGEYSVKIVVDLNGNGRWDSGNYDLRRQPEVIITQKLEQLRANWEVEAKISL